MSEQKTISHAIKRREGTSLLVVAVLLVLLLAASAVYFNLQKGALADEQKRLDQDIVALNGELSRLQSQNIEGAQSAQKWLAEIKKEEIMWSKVIDAIKLLLPVDEKTGKPIVTILSYSGGQGGKINLNMQSKAGNLNTFANVAKLIASFASSSYFADAVIPSIARGETDNGDVLLSYVMSMSYKEDRPIVSASTDSSTQQEAGTARKVPR